MYIGYTVTDQCCRAEMQAQFLPMSIADQEDYTCKKIIYM